MKKRKIKNWITLAVLVVVVVILVGIILIKEREVKESKETCIPGLESGEECEIKEPVPQPLPTKIIAELPSVPP